MTPDTAERICRFGDPDEASLPADMLDIYAICVRTPSFIRSAARPGKG